MRCAGVMSAMVAGIGADTGTLEETHACRTLRQVDAEMDNEFCLKLTEWLE